MNTFLRAHRNELFAALAIAIFLVFTTWPAIQRNLGATDFAVFYAAGYSTRSIDGTSPADMFTNKKRFRNTIKHFRPLELGGTKFLYLPPAALFFVPLTVLPYALALPAWTLGISLVFILAYYASIRVLIDDKDIFAPRYSALLIVFAFSTSALRLLQTGQVNSIVWLLLMLFFLGMQRDRAWLAGISLSTVIVLKVFPVILVPLLIIKRQWKALGVAAASGLLFLLAGVAVIGIDNLQPYIQNTLVDDILLSKPSTEGSTIAANAWRSVKAFHLQPRKTYRSIIEHASTALSILSLLGTYLLLWKRRHDVQPPLREYTPFILIILLFPLFTHTEWMIWLIPLCIWGITRPQRWMQALTVLMITLTQFWQYTEKWLGWQPVLKTMTLGVLVATVIWWATLVRKTKKVVE